MKWSHPLYQGSLGYRTALSDALLGFGCGALVPIILLITTILYLYNQGAFK